MEIYKVVSADETLNRLLHYLPENALDDPLDPAKPNIMDMGAAERDELIQSQIKFTPTTDELITDKPVSRLFFHAGRRKPNSSYYYADQNVFFDVFTHKEFNDKDLRLNWLVDRINELMSDQYIGNAFKVISLGGQPLSAPENYLGYSLQYKFDNKNVVK